MKYIIPQSWIEATKEERRIISNGCGAGWKKFNSWYSKSFYKLLNRAIPDTIYGLSISDICDWHDFDYTFLKKTQENKKQADNDFYHNLQVRIKDKSGMLEWLRLRRAKKYYFFVNKFGDDAFYKG